MKIKAIVVILAISMLATTLAVSRVKAVPNPLPTNLLFNFYPGDAAEMAAMTAGSIDIIDVPVDSATYATWLTSTTITMESYSEAGYYLFDLNNQKWPTGVWALGGHTVVGEPAPGTLDYAAWHFRRGIAYSFDKATLIATPAPGGLGGMAYPILTPIPYPLDAGYTDYPTIIANGWDYAFNPQTAANELALAGFIPGSQTNPYYDGSLGSSLKLLKDTTMNKDPMDPITVLVRNDHTPRALAGNMLVAQLRREGVNIPPWNGVTGFLPAGRAQLYPLVMVADANNMRNYNIYTGGWIDMIDPDYLYDLYSSAGYSDTPNTFAYNYPGFMNSEYDPYADSVKFSSFKDMNSIFKCQEVLAKYCGVIPGWTPLSYKAYGASWSDVVNDIGRGVNNWHSMSLMNAPSYVIPSTLRYGFMSDPEMLNPISSEWYWDRIVTDNGIYSFLGDRNPYDYGFDLPGVATELPTTAVWTDPVTGNAGMSIKFKIRNDVDFQDGTPLTLDDVKFSLEFSRDCGPGVSWTYQFTFPIHHIDTNPATNEVTVYLTLKSFWAVHWMFGANIINKAIYLYANQPSQLNWGYKEGRFTWLTQDTDGTNVIHVGSTANWQAGDAIDINWGLVGTVSAIGGTPYDPQLILSAPIAAGAHVVGEEVTLDWNRLGIKNYASWTRPHPTVAGLTEDIGTGPWVFQSWIAGTWITMTRFTGYFRSEANWASFLRTAWANCHGLVNYPHSYWAGSYPYLDWIDDIFEINAVWKAWGSTPSWPAGIGWGQWNKDCDFNSDNHVYIEDLYTVGKNFGTTAVWPFASTWP